MKRGIEFQQDYDKAGQWCCHIRKKRGKLTLEEIREILQECLYQDFFMLVVSTIDAETAQYYDVDDLDSDFVTLYRADDFFKWREK